MTQRKIIWAEDDFLARDVLGRLIRGMLQPDVTLEVVCDGRDLVGKMRSGGYCLALTDGDMISMDGPDAIRAIRAFDAKTPIYLLSGNVYSPKEVKGIGANGHIYKSDIKEKLPAVLKNHALGR